MSLLRLLLAVLALACAGPTLAAAERLSPDQSLRMAQLRPARDVQLAAVRVYNPNGPSQLGGGGHAFGPGGASWTPASPNGVAWVGDSREANGVNISASGVTLTGSMALSLGYPEWISLASANNFLPLLTSTFGVGSTTSRNQLDRLTVASNYAGTTIGSSTTTSATGSETVVAYSGTGNFPGYLTPGSQAATGWVKVTFGTPASVGSACTGSGTYTPYAVTDSAGDTINGGCVNNAASAAATHGGSTRDPYGNFTITQSASCTSSGASPCAQSGDNFTFTTFGPQARAFTVTTDSVDMEFNIQSSGGASATGDASNAAVVIDSINDAGYGNFPTPVSGTAYGQCPGPDYPSYTSMPAVAPCLSMVTVAAILDKLTAAGKTIVLADESPQGTSLAQLESHAVSAHTSGSGTAQVTATNSGSFLLDGNSFSGSTTSLGQSVANVPGLIGVVSGAYTVYAKVASAPGVGQYSVSAGVYSFNNTDPLWVTGGTAYLTYSYGSGGTSSYQAIMHLWLKSSAADFVDPGTGTGRATDYHFPGALYGRPNVYSLPMFEALVDTSGSNYSDTTCSTSACNAIPGALDSLKKHPTPYGAALVGAAFKTLWSGIPAYAALPDNTQAPAFDNLRCARSNGSTLTWTCTMPATMLSTGHPAATLWYGSTSVTEASGAFSNADIASSSVNYSTGAVSITFNSGHVPANQTYLWLFEDASNLVSNALFDASGSGYASDKVAPCTGTGLTYLPSGWSCALASGGGLTFTWATGTGADGYPALSVTVTGVATATGTLTLTNGTVGDTTTYGRAAGQVLRAGVNEIIGPNGGALIGLYDAQLKLSETAGSFTHAGFYSLNSPSANQSQLTAMTAQVASAGGNGTTSTYPFSDLNTNGVAGNSGGVVMNLLTTPIDWTGATPSSGAALASILHWAAGPVNATVTWSRAQYRIRSN
jgi:hypothetical protein